MRISLKILESDREISKKIGQALLPDVAKYLKQKLNIIRSGLPDIVNNNVINTPEYASLIGGKLQYEFGIPDAQSRLAGLLNIWSRNIDITYVPPKIIGNGEIRANFTVGMIRIDFSDVLFSEYATFTDTFRGYTLPWLQWLLLEGNRILVPGYQVIVGPNSRSRTGFAVMRASPVQAWKVPAEFSGSIGDNWITRSLDKSTDEINSFLKKALES